MIYFVTPAHSSTADPARAAQLRGRSEGKGAPGGISIGHSTAPSSRARPGARVDLRLNCSTCGRFQDDGKDADLHM